MAPNGYPPPLAHEWVFTLVSTMGRGFSVHPSFPLASKKQTIGVIFLSAIVLCPVFPCRVCVRKELFSPSAWKGHPDRTTGLLSSTSSLLCGFVTLVLSLSFSPHEKRKFGRNRLSRSSQADTEWPLTQRARVPPTFPSLFVVFLCVFLPK